MVDATGKGAVDGQEDATTRRARALELDGSPNPVAPAVGEYAKSLSELGEALGVSKARAGQLSKEDWFPRRSERGWDVDVCRRARAAHGRGETPPVLAPVSPPPPAAPAAPAAPLPAPYPPPLDSLPGANPLIDRERERARLEREALQLDAPILDVLRTSRDPEALAQAGAELQARRLARDPSTRPEDLKKALEEWRRMASDVVELKKAKGELVAREILSSLGGQLGARMAGAFERLDGRLAAQVEAWIGEPRFLALTIEARAREVREWSRRTTNNARTIEADEVERIIATEIAERAEA